MLEYIKLKLTFSVISERLTLPEYKGSTFRGMLKTSLKSTCCVVPGGLCRDCILRHKCVYAVVTENRTPSGENTVLPYTVACAGLRQCSCNRGETLSFEIVLAGQAADSLPYIVFSLTNWQKLDVGGFQPLAAGNRVPVAGGRLCLERTDQVLKTGENRVLYTREQEILTSPEPETILCGTPADKGTGKVKITFLSPTRIFRKTGDRSGKYAKKPIQPQDFDFNLFFRAILTRITGLYIHFGNGPDDFGRSAWERLAPDAEKASLVRNDLVMKEIRRYRMGNTRWANMDGFMGEAVFENVAGSLMPYIRAGEILQIGKFPTMGFGEYKAEEIQ